MALNLLHQPAVGILAFTVIFFRMPWTRLYSGDRPRLDILGALLLGGAVVPFLLAMVWGGDRYAWESTQILGLVAVSLVALALFVLAEARAAEPLVPLYALPQPHLRRLGRVAAAHRRRDVCLADADPATSRA